jgi:hypothetical protein
MTTFENNEFDAASGDLERASGGTRIDEKGITHLFTAPASQRGSDHAVPRLARFFRLDTWGSSLLTRSAVNQMGYAADLLLVVFVFELGMWTLLFNSMVYAAPLHFGLKTPIAAGIAFLFAYAVLVWEKSVITADLPSNQLRKRMPKGQRPKGWVKPLVLLGRMSMIGLSIYANAKSLDLFMFNGAIEQRLKEESVLQEAIQQAEDQAAGIEKQDRQVAAVDKAMTGSTVEQDKKTTAAEQAAARAQELKDEALLTAANDRLAQTRIRLATAGERVIQRQRQLSAEPRNSANFEAIAASLEAARSDQRSLATAVGIIEGTLPGLRRTADKSDHDRTEADRSADAALKSYNDERKRQEALESARAAAIALTVVQRKEWLVVLQGAPYGSAQTRPSFGIGPPAVSGQAATNAAASARSPFQWKTADFLDRLRILNHLMEGTPPRWPITDAATRERAIKLFQVPSGDTDVAKTQREAEAGLFRSANWMALIIAGLIPMLALGFKLLLIGPELDAYYSCWSQARHGNIEALDILHSQGFDIDETAPVGLAESPAL